MLLPFIAPADLSTEQRQIYEDMRTGIEKDFQGFKSIAENGALMGPWNPWPRADGWSPIDTDSWSASGATMG
jgi:hypothetical protein